SRKKKHKSNSQKLNDLNTSKNNNIEEPTFSSHSSYSHNTFNFVNSSKLAKLVITGLGLKKLPDMRKANISQFEYSSKYIEYLERLRRNIDLDVAELSSAASLQFISVVTNRFSEVNHRKRAIRASKNCERRSVWNGGHEVRKSERTNILLHFPLSYNDAKVDYDRIDEANVRLMMIYNPSLSRKKSVSSILKNKKNRICNAFDRYSTSQSKSHIHAVNLKIFQILQNNRRLQLDARRIEFDNANNNNEEETHSQWLEFDVTEAVRGWLNKTHENLGVEIQCDRCRRFGARIISDALLPHQNQHQDQDQDRFQLTPVLNIIGHVGQRSTTHIEDKEAYSPKSNRNQSYVYHRLTLDYRNQSKQWPNSCYRTHQRCCRHPLDVTFKDIKGFEFIIQPKTFDAGYCKGRCPPRHNPANHHALLQSLMWQQNHDRAPRPCCAPSKLTHLEILHVDEEHSDKLKISTWSDMQVLECACS
ncbi:hypothetical protein KR222_003115, partial [Zaprionus bogoriensis]